MISDKYKKADCIEREELPALADSNFIGLNLVKPIGKAIDQLRKTSFWRGENIRIHRDDGNFYFDRGI